MQRNRKVCSGKTVSRNYTDTRLNRQRFNYKLFRELQETISEDLHALIICITDMYALQNQAIEIFEKLLS